jgi:hypothetical protein
VFGTEKRYYCQAALSRHAPAIRCIAAAASAAGRTNVLALATRRTNQVSFCSSSRSTAVMPRDESPSRSRRDRSRSRSRGRRRQSRSPSRDRDRDKGRGRCEMFHWIVFASPFRFVFLGAGDEIAAAAATRAIKGVESVTELGAAAAAEIGRGRGRGRGRRRGRGRGRGTRTGKRRRSAPRIATGTGVVSANARASLVVHPPQTKLPRLLLQPPPLPKTTSLPRGAKSCGLGPHNSRFLQLA